MRYPALPLCLAALLIGGGAIAQPAASPPDRVGRVAAVRGPVSFHLAGAAAWQGAVTNLPVTTGTAIRVALAGEAALGLGDGNRLLLGPSTELDIDRFDDAALAATQPDGETYLRLRLLRPGDTVTIQTPRGTVTIATAGRYAIASGDTEHPTAVTVLEGAATLTGLPSSADIGPGQTLTVTGDGAATPFTPTLGPAVPDAFLRHAVAEDPALRPATAPPIVAAMTGAEALDGVGEWAETPDYGPVWYPPVASYVPYRQGRWSYVAPWGWTWIDDAPWGFAPTHYGRWAQFGNRWGWVPGRDWAPDRRPVYAPALVGFLAGATLGAGRVPAVGWAPLGPHDTYRPPYPVPDRVVQALNQPTGASGRITDAPVTINRSALTIVAPSVLTASAPVAGAFRPGPLPAVIGPGAVQFRPPVSPTRATIGAIPPGHRPLPLVISPDTARPPEAAGFAGRARPEIPSGPRPTVLNGGPREPRDFPRPAPFTMPRPERFAAPRPVVAPFRPAPPAVQRVAPPPRVERPPGGERGGRPGR